MNELELIQAAQAGDNNAKTALLKMHHGYILSIVRRQCRNAQDYGDYLSVAQMGFLKAIDKYDPVFECSLVTYSRGWVSQALRRYREVDCTVRPPYNPYLRVRRREELGEYDGTKTDKRRSNLDQLLASEVTSLNVPYYDGGDDLIDCIPASTPTPEDEIAARQEVDLLKQRMCGRDAREVATLLRGDKTLAEVGKSFRVSRERIRQVEGVGLGKLRAAYGAAGATQ